MKPRGTAREPEPAPPEAATYERRTLVFCEGHGGCLHRPASAPAPESARAPTLEPARAPTLEPAPAPTPAPAPAPASRVTPIPHCPGVPPPPQLAGGVHVPQLAIRLPHPSPAGPHVM